MPTPSSTTNTTTMNSGPGFDLLSKNAVAQTLYVLYYRQGNNPHPQSKQFYLPFPTGDMKKVVERVKLHCERMNLRFTNVRPFYSDLDREENILLNRESENSEG